MALHQVKLPKSAVQLLKIIVLQKRLLKALADPGLNSAMVNTAWVQNVWHMLDSEWVRQFCLGGQENRIKSIAQAMPVARQALYDEFCRQNKVEAMLYSGGNFQDLNNLPGFNTQLATEVKEFFKQCYKLLSTNKDRKWNGYMFGGDRSITNSKYKDDFCSYYPTMVICPYCDGEIGTPELDHYLSQSGFPLLSCSPWNLIPACHSCNVVGTAKGNKAAITPGPPNSTNDWLHPFFRPASLQVHISLSGTPRNSIPRLYSPDTTEQTRLNNHMSLIQSLSKRWTNIAAAQFDVLVREVNLKVDATKTLESLIRTRLEDHLESRGRAASSMIHAGSLPGSS